jgi:hypothetical protein
VWVPTDSGELVEVMDFPPSAVPQVRVPERLTEGETVYVKLGGAPKVIDPATATVTGSGDSVNPLAAPTRYRETPLGATSPEQLDASSVCVPAPADAIDVPPSTVVHCKVPESDVAGDVVYV